MATRRTDIRRGGIDLATIVADPSMIDGNGKLKFPEGNLSPNQTEILNLLLASIKIEQDAETGIYTLSPVTNAGTSLGSDAFKFKDLYVDVDSIYMGSTKISLKNDTLSVSKLVTNPDTGAIEEETQAELSFEKIKQSLLDDQPFKDAFAALLGTGPQGKL